MLSEIRERATGWIAYIIVGIIIIPFAFWGVNEYFAGGEDVVVATVEGVEIDQNRYRQALESRRAQMRQVLGDNFDPELANSPEFKRGVINDLVSQVLLSRHAEELGYRIGDRQLAETIRSNPRFQENGSFSQDAYARAMAQMGLTETGFESRLRQEMVLQQIRNGVRQSEFVTPDQERQLIELLIQKRRFEYAVMEPQRFIDDVEVTEEEIAEEYEANSDAYRTPERMKVEYVELSVDDLAADVSVTDAEIQRAYEQNRDRFGTDPVRRASHILIETGDTEESTQQALAEARRLLEELRSGADFAALAREHSDDPGSAQQGGDLGRIESGSMVPRFEQALFELEEEGALTDPVKTRFGYHIIKLTEYEPATIKPLEEVRDQLLAEEQARQAESMFLDRAETFRNVSYEQPQSLEPVADRLDLEIQQSDWFTRDRGTGIASNPDIREAAFSEDVREEGLNSEAMELNINTLVVIRRLETQPAALKPLEEVRAEIVARIKRRKAREQLAVVGPELVGQLDGGADWQSLVAERGLVSEEATRSRSESAAGEGPPPALVGAVFRAGRPESDGAVYGGVPLEDGRYALFRLVEVTDVDPADATEELKQRVSSGLIERRSQDILEQYIADLRERSEVNIKDSAL